MEKRPAYNKNLKPLARKLRNESTMGEVIVWTEVLRAKKMLGYQFNRQLAYHVDGINIIVDFICRKLKLIIEVDGYSHNFKRDKDEKRDEKLYECGYHVLRIGEKEVRNDLDNVVRIIEQKVLELEIVVDGDQSPWPLFKGGCSGVGSQSPWPPFQRGMEI